MKSRFFNVLLDLLFDVFFWLLRVKDTGPDIPVSASASAERAQAASRSIFVGGQHG
jgi:hypothetical protein